MSNDASAPIGGRWTEQSVWELVSIALDLQDDGQSRNYWYDASQGVALLLAAVQILVNEIATFGPEPAHHSALVRKIIELTERHSDDIKQRVIEVLLTV